MTKSEFQRKVFELLRKYRITSKMKEKIIPLFSLVDSLNQEEMTNVYNIVKEAIITQKQTEELTSRLQMVFADFNNTIRDVSKKLYQIRKRLENLRNPMDAALVEASVPPIQNELNNTKIGKAMKYNRQSFPGEKPNPGLKLTKLFSSFITEYGPEHVTLVVSDSILYTNNLILRISLKTKDVLIGSSRSIRLYETDDGSSFLITDKPEVIPYGNSYGFYYKTITYDDILNLTNGDFFKVFDSEILETYKRYEVELPVELKSVGYYKIE